MLSMLIVLCVLLLLMIWFTLSNNVFCALLNFMAYAVLVVLSFMPLSTAFSILLLVIVLNLVLLFLFFLFLSGHSYVMLLAV
jgi:hypothetical protein